MTTVSWPSGVNSKFFKCKGSPADNSVTTQFDGGRTVAYLKNTAYKWVYSCSLKLDRLGTEADTFWSWFTDTLGGCTGHFTCSALGSGTYRFQEVPTPEDTDQRRLILNMMIEEV